MASYWQFALALALRTGLNTTPLLELRRDCLKPHPFMPRMRLLETFKRRGNATQVKSLRYTRTELTPTSIPMDGVALLEHLLKRNEPLAAVAPPELRDAVWLYQPQAMAHRGKLTRLTEPALKRNIRGFVQRHSLVGDDGKPLELTMSRLRKTMENRLWQLSHGDLFTVAAIMGHDPKVADQSYLAVTPEMRANATIVGEALPDVYRTADTEAERKSPGNQATREDFERTPVGRCKDSLNGDRAPRDGTHCMDFLSCFGCRSYAIVGSREDLHRLFSFYWFLDGERQSIRSGDWREHFASVMSQIDSFTLDKFDNALVREAKESARCEPLKFWRRRSAANKPGAADGT